VLNDEAVVSPGATPGDPRDLETICLRCLAKQPRSRYPNATALAADLHAFLEGKPIAARPAGNLERTVKWTRGTTREPISAAEHAAAMLAFAFGSIFYSLTIRDPHCTIADAVNRADEGDIRLRQEAYTSQWRWLMHSVERDRDSLLTHVLHARLPGCQREGRGRFRVALPCGPQALRNPRVSGPPSQNGRWSNFSRRQLVRLDRPQCHPQNLGHTGVAGCVPPCQSTRPDIPR